MQKALPTKHPSTLCVHAGTHLDQRTGGICSPIFPATSYIYPNAAEENVYPRYFNVPNQRVVGDKMAALEKGEAAVVFGSGMAAISTLLFAHLKPGDHAVFQADLYGGTYHFVTEELAQFGIACSFARTLDEFRAAIQAVNHGGTLDAHACYQLERGLKTLSLRVSRQNENAGRLAEFLLAHPAVARVNYPGLAGHPDHPVAARQMRGYGGMLSFELQRASAVDSVLRRFTITTPALSLGGVETLACVPARTSHRALSAQQRHAAGISDGLIRVSAGIEHIEDLVADFEQALSGQ